MKIMGRNKQQTENLNQIRNLPIAQVQPNPMQPRKYFSQEELASLAASIRENGLLQPITVREMEGHYELVAGERRLRASKLAGLTVIPAIVLRMDDNQSAILSLVENIQRADLNFVEEALAIKRLMAQYSYTQEDVARLRVEHSVEELSSRQDAYAHAGADGDVDGGVKAFRAAPGGLTQHGAVYIRVKSHGNVQLVL